ncbi:hypothetical protein [Pseudoalteromonas denitrificans]|uniref:DUF4402 domain-containing protein n=1 Tax=Pseudoalteromonas denitrificans DSM 6059 TaxID=1123010 RepID=A0A1I1HVZ9_9GAMM|nr:hypothetical protein [Pseudoalteromonas denitrificans]SFC25633.1 hypothetical protein SAMN02745724_01281 [Pseudoalteromonas denitrificans DSM 6059]
MLKINVNLKIKVISFLSSVLFYPIPALALEEYIQQQKTISFGQTIPRIGSCELDPFTETMTSPQTICIDSHTLGHYKIFGDANLMLKIILHKVDDISGGVFFAPKGRLKNNLGDDVSAPISEAETWIRIGSDGILDIYVGGTLTLTKVQNSSSSITLQYNIEFNEP